MCGIAGVFCAPDVDALAAIHRMNDAMVHRGPDDVGDYFCHTDDAVIALGSRRLSILDLSSAGHQPMLWSDGSSALVFNGAIYNFRELRSRLIAERVSFRSNSDTEVILAGYRRWGADALVRELRGMFAFALWDVGSRQLLLARDRLGVKPLYVARTKNALIFASEVRALLATGLVERQISQLGLQTYLRLGAIEEPHTIVRDIVAFPSGHIAYVRAPRFVPEAHPYWSLSTAFEQEPVSDSRILRPRLRAELETAVALRLESDAPIGVFLSGGLDSSLVTTLASRTKGPDLRTVSVVFDEAAFSEERYINAVVSRLGAQHTSIRLNGTGLLGDLPGALNAMDQPTFDGINTYVVATAARQAGLKVALSGIGGDELFGGYPSFRRVRLLRARPAQFARPMASWLGPSVTRRFGDSLRKGVYALQQSGDLSALLHVTRELFSSDARKRLVPSAPPIELSNPVIPPGLDLFNAVSFFELSHYLKNVLLRDTDCMGMALSIEIREPLLDHRLVESVAAIPGSYKQGRGPKPLLRETVTSLLPREILFRSKMGFTLPFDRWLRVELRKTVESVLLDADYGAMSTLLDHDDVRELWQRFTRGRTHWTRPWAIYALKMWTERNLR